MRRTLIIASTIIASTAAAGAADLVTKAPKLGSFDLGGAGWYVGAGTEASVERASVSNTNLFATSLVSGNLTATGGTVKGVVGYISGRTANWWYCEAGAGYQNITGANNVGGSFASRWSATQECGFSAALLQKLYDALPNLAGGLSFPTFSPSLPANVLVASAPRQYVTLGAKESGISGTFGTVAGSSVSFAPMLKTGFLWQTVDSTGKPTGGALDASASVSWPLRGFTVNGVGNSAGVPVTFSAGESLGPQYTAGLTYKFGL